MRSTIKFVLRHNLMMFIASAVAMFSTLFFLQEKTDVGIVVSILLSQAQGFLIAVFVKFVVQPSILLTIKRNEEIDSLISARRDFERYWSLMTAGKVNVWGDLPKQGSSKMGEK